jgi:hypothetical protein
MNVHNLATNAFEQAYYLGGFIILTVLPFMRNSVKKVLLQFTHFQTLIHFVPPAWFLIPFSVISFFVVTPAQQVTGANNPLYMLMYIFTLAILLAISSNKRAASGVSPIALTIAFTAAALCLATIPFTEYTAARHWLFFECSNVVQPRRATVRTLTRQWTAQPW